MEPITATKLKKIISQIDHISEDDSDELLTDLLVRAYPTRRTQDN